MDKIPKKDQEKAVIKAEIPDVKVNFAGGGAVAYIPKALIECGVLQVGKTYRVVFEEVMRLIGFYPSQAATIA